MMPLREIRVKSARSKKSLVHDIKIGPGNPEKSTFKRNVLQMKADVAKKKKEYSCKQCI